jgi:hypothetical protein
MPQNASSPRGDSDQSILNLQAVAEGAQATRRRQVRGLQRLPPRGSYCAGDSSIPASLRADRTFASRSASRASMIRWACGDPAPCIDSVR